MAWNLLLSLPMKLDVTFINKLLDVSMERHKVLANNLANVNTPGYERQDVRFRDALTDALKNRDVKAMESFKPEIYTDKTRSYRPDGNNVSAQVELAEMTENQLFYRMTSKIMASKLQRLKKAIGGAGGGGG